MRNKILLEWLQIVLGLFGSGVVMQFVYNLLYFESREIIHRDVVEITR